MGNDKRYHDQTWEYEYDNEYRLENEVQLNDRFVKELALSNLQIKSTKIWLIYIGFGAKKQQLKVYLKIKSLSISMTLKLHWHVCKFENSHLRFVSTGCYNIFSITSCFQTVRSFGKFEILNELDSCTEIYRDKRLIITTKLKQSILIWMFTEIFL